MSCANASTAGGTCSSDHASLLAAIPATNSAPSAVSSLDVRRTGRVRRSAASHLANSN